jgi:hypothetical protein
MRCQDLPSDHDRQHPERVLAAFLPSHAKIGDYGRIFDAVSIRERLATVENLEPGHSEGELLFGSVNSGGVRIMAVAPR